MNIYLYMYEVKAGTLMTLMEWIAHAHTCDTKARQGEFVVSSSSSILLAQFFASFFFLFLASFSYFCYFSKELRFAFYHHWL